MNAGTINEGQTSPTSQYHCSEREMGEGEAEGNREVSLQKNVAQAFANLGKRGSYPPRAIHIFHNNRKRNYTHANRELYLL